jgi:ring-1,2-phenylacetyl-CoA epoxidase subunit PaaE
MVGEFIPLVVREVRRETADAISIFFDYPGGDKESFPYHPGQYLTIKWKDGEEEHRRSYSISSVPDDPFISIAIKEVPKGTVSPILSREIKPGDTLEVMFPEGRFTTEFHPDKKRTIFLIGAGSGITPLMSLVRTALEKEPKSTVVLLYGSRTEAQIIFKNDLEKLANRYQGQFFVYHTLSKPEDGGLLKGLFGKKKTEWQGMKGRISLSHIKNILDKHPGNRDNAIFFLCGPGDFIQTTEKSLLSLGIKEDLVKKEYFTPPSTEHPTLEDGKSMKHTGKTATVTVHLRGETITIPVKDDTILDTLLSLGYDAPYSCHAGACATCMAKVLQGSVEMDACFALNDHEIASGYILSCQSHPTTEVVEITYDE